METTQAPEAATAQPTETPETKPQTETTTTTKPKEKSEGGKDVGERIHRLLAKEKEPGFDKHSDEDLDFLENEYYSGKNKPSKPVSAEADEPDEGEKTEGDQPEDDQDQKEEKEPKAKISKEIEDAMKEVGAKTPEELPGKIKELRKQLSGKDAQAVATLTKQIKAEQALMEDVRKGVPEALDHLKKVYGLELVAAGTRPQQAQQQAQTQTEALPFTPEDDALVGGALSRMYNLLQQSQKTVGGLQETFQQQQERVQKEAATTRAQADTIDEIWTVSQGIPGVKDIPNLRSLVNDWVKSGNEDPRLAPLSELFEIATKEGVSLTVAAKLKKAEDAERLIAEAETRGREAAYKHKPNPSLSGITGGKGETTTYTEEQYQEMAQDHRKIPEDWFDDNDNLIESKIPRKARRFFGFAPA